MKIKFKKFNIMNIVIVMSIISLWITGIIPSFIAKTSSEKYVEANYKSKELKFLKVYWDNNWQRYFASFTDKSGEVYNFKMSGYIPSTIMYDPLDPPG